MGLLVDENFPGETGEALRSRGHDVAWVRVDAPGAAEGAILGAGSGAIVGYGGGVGSLKTIFDATGRGALYGAAGGAVLGGAQFALTTFAIPGVTLPDAWAGLGKVFTGKMGLGKFVGLTASLIPPEAVQYVFFPALQVGAGIELTDPFADDAFDFLKRTGLLKDIKAKGSF